MRVPVIPPAVPVEDGAHAAHALPDRRIYEEIPVLCNPPMFDILMNAMEFQIERNSPVPVIKQVQEQIKLSIAMGMLKRGDVLPPIREVEKQTGINRGQIHRAYLAMRKSGLLSPAPDKGTLVAVSAAAPDSINHQCQELSRDIINWIRRIWKSPEFARV